MGGVIKLKKRLDESKESVRRWFNRLEDLLVKLFKREGGERLG